MPHDCNGFRFLAVPLPMPSIALHTVRIFGLQHELNAQPFNYCVRCVSQYKCEATTQLKVAARTEQKFHVDAHRTLSSNALMFIYIFFVIILSLLL